MSQVAPIKNREPVEPEARKAFSPKVRAQVLLKTLGLCAHCAAKIHGGRFEVDHIAELWEGGSNEIGNLQPLCPDCHKAKSAKGRGRHAKALRQAEACLEREPDAIEPSRMRSRGFDQQWTKGVNGKVRPRKQRRTSSPSVQQALSLRNRAEGECEATPNLTKESR